MSRKNVLYGYDLFSGINTISATTISNEVPVAGHDYGSIHMFWAGSTLNATASIQVRNGPNDQWRNLTFSSPISIAGTSGENEIILNQMPFTDIRMQINVVSGSGTMSAFITAKQVGG